MSLIAELKRRNVFRMGVLYLVASWVLLQVADVVFPALGIPDWGMGLVLGLLMLGFPVALTFSWVYELTPEGIKRERDIDRSESITGTTRPKDQHVDRGPAGTRYRGGHRRPADPGDRDQQDTGDGRSGPTGHGGGAGRVGRWEWRE